MKTGIIIYAFHLAGELHRLLSHVLNETDAQVYLFRHSQVPLVMTVCEQFAADMRVHYYPYGENRGLARSVNDGLLDGYMRDGMDVMLTCNDDVQPSPGDIEKLARAAMENPEAYLVEGWGKCGGRDEWIDLSCGVITRRALEVIGCHDENFFPAYFEDVDFHLRAWKLGMKRLRVQETHFVHAGSASLSSVEQERHNRQFIANRDYFMRKWGTQDAEQSFPTPFNQPGLSWYIAPESRHNPYPGFNREDLQS